MLHWQNNSAHDVLRFTAKLDGTGVGAKWQRPHEQGSIFGIRVGPTAMQPFQFSQLKTTGEASQRRDAGAQFINVHLDADDALHAPANADLGTIRVQVLRVQLFPVKKPESTNFTLGFRSVGPIHERSKKLGAHCVTFGWCPLLE